MSLKWLDRNVWVIQRTSDGDVFNSIQKDSRIIPLFSSRAEVVDYLKFFETAGRKPVYECEPGEIDKSEVLNSLRFWRTRGVTTICTGLPASHHPTECGSEFTINEAIAYLEDQQ